MWRNNLLIATRLLARHRVYSAINIGGLALGLAGCLLIWSYIRHERSSDAWLPDSERVYQVQATWHEPGQPVSRSSVKAARPNRPRQAPITASTAKPAKVCARASSAS